MWNVRFEDAHLMIKHLVESEHPTFRGISAFNRGRSAIHFIAESPNIELLFRKIHSANQLSIYGAVSSWCDDLVRKILGQTSLSVDTSISRVNDQLSKNLDPQEVGSSVQNPTRTEGAAGNSLHDHLQQFKGLDPEVLSVIFGNQHDL